jgi:hypothetical protein
MSKFLEFQIAITGAFPVGEDSDGQKEERRHEIISAIESVLLPLRASSGVELGMLVMNVGEPPWQSRS